MSFNARGSEERKVSRFGFQVSSYKTKLLLFSRNPKLTPPGKKIGVSALET
jgi:hypothetical protein